jgi:hypothetical protein
MLVDLDELRAQLGPHAQVGEALAKIVDGDLEAAPAIVQQGLVDAGQIGDPLVLGQFEHDAVGGQPSSLSKARVWPFIRRLSSRQVGVTLRNNRPARRWAAKARRLASRLACSRSSAAAARGGGEELIRAMQRAVFRPADQRFVAQDGAHTKIQDGLEDREQQAFRQDALEFHCLFVNSHNRFNRKNQSSSLGGDDCRPLQGAPWRHAAVTMASHRARHALSRFCREVATMEMKFCYCCRVHHPIDQMRLFPTRQGTAGAVSRASSRPTGRMANATASASNKLPSTVKRPAVRRSSRNDCAIWRAPPLTRRHGQAAYRHARPEQPGAG